MKLIASTYTNAQKLIFNLTNVEINDIGLTHKRFDRYLSIEFNMLTNTGILLTTNSLSFDDSSNRTTTVLVDGEIISLFDYIDVNGSLPPVYEMVDWGYPTYEKVLTYFEGGDLDNPEIIITDPFGQQWLLNTLEMFNEKVIAQFTYL